MILYNQWKTDGYGTVTIGQWGGWFIQIAPMIFNDRLVLTPIHSPLTYDYGWCFPKGASALLAAMAWDMEHQGEPVGYIKAIWYDHPRQAGEVAAGSVAEFINELVAQEPGVRRHMNQLDAFLRGTRNRPPEPMTILAAAARRIQRARAKLARVHRPTHARTRTRSPRALAGARRNTRR